MQSDRGTEKIGLDQVVKVLSKSLSVANSQISSAAKEGKDGLAYVATEISVAFPAEFHISDSKPVVRFVDLAKQVTMSGNEKTDIGKPAENTLATITIHLKPVPV